MMCVCVVAFKLWLSCVYFEPHIVFIDPMRKYGGVAAAVGNLPRNVLIDSDSTHGS